MTREEAEQRLYRITPSPDRCREILDALQALEIIKFDMPPNTIWIAVYDIRYDEYVARQIDETKPGVQEALKKGHVRKITPEEAATLRSYEP